MDIEIKIGGAVIGSQGGAKNVEYSWIDRAGFLAMADIDSFWKSTI